MALQHHGTSGDSARLLHRAIANVVPWPNHRRLDFRQMRLRNVFGRAQRTGGLRARGQILTYEQKKKRGDVEGGANANGARDVENAGMLDAMFFFYYVSKLGYQRENSYKNIYRYVFILLYKLLGRLYRRKAEWGLFAGDYIIRFSAKPPSTSF